MVKQQKVIEVSICDICIKEIEETQENINPLKGENRCFVCDKDICNNHTAIVRFTNQEFGYLERITLCPEHSTPVVEIVEEIKTNIRNKNI